MSLILSLVGRYDAGLFERLAREVVESEPEAGFDSWSLAYCYGNRLEILRSEGRNGQLDLGGLMELKTDMAFLCLCRSGSGVAAGPFLRREHAGLSGFQLTGEVRHPENLRYGLRVSDGAGSGELLLLHMLEAMDPNDPAESVQQALAGLKDEPDLSFFMLSSNLLVVSHWREPEEAPGLWMGEADLLRVVAPRPLHSISELKWEPVPDRTVLAVSRLRRPIA